MYGKVSFCKYDRQNHCAICWVLWYGDGDSKAFANIENIYGNEK